MEAFFPTVFPKPETLNPRMGPTMEFPEMFQVQSLNFEPRLQSSNFEVRSWNFEVWLRSLAWKKKKEKEKTKKNEKKKKEKNSGWLAWGEGKTSNIEVQTPTSKFNVQPRRSNIEVPTPTSNFDVRTSNIVLRSRTSRVHVRSRNISRKLGPRC